MIGSAGRSMSNARDHRGNPAWPARVLFGDAAQDGVLHDMYSLFYSLAEGNPDPATRLISL